MKVVSQHLIPDYLDTIYNIEGEGFHNYHVGELGTWVHNADCDQHVNAKEFTADSENINAQDALNRKFAALEKAQNLAKEVKKLPDGRIRYYN